MLELRDVRFAWATGAEFRFSLNVKPGEIVAIVGESGAGKSTLLDLIAGFAAPTNGQLTWHDDDLIALAPHERPISVLFQSGNLFEHLSAARNVALGVHATGRLDEKTTDAVEDALSQMGLVGLGNRLPGELSGGQCQRVALARVLIRQRPILLLDEPFSALDPQTRLDILQVVKTIVDERQLATLLVSHSREDLKALAARVVTVRERHCVT